MFEKIDRLHEQMAGEPVTRSRAETRHGRPAILCHMLGSIDGRLHPSRYTDSPDGARDAWSAVYERLHEALHGDAWMVGRVTMAEMSKAAPHPPAQPGPVERPVHVARVADRHAIAIDRDGKLHFDGALVGGDHVVVLLGPDVSDTHLAELSADGVSYIVAEDAAMDLTPLLATLRTRFNVHRLLLEGGAGVNGSLLAAGLVDELSVVVAPALDGGTDVQGIVAAGDGLRGKVELSLISAEVLEHGTVHLRYRVLPPAADRAEQG